MNQRDRFLPRVKVLLTPLLQPKLLLDRTSRLKMKPVQLAVDSDLVLTGLPMMNLAPPEENTMEQGLAPAS